jgi:hypothetical protein
LPVFRLAKIGKLGHAERRWLLIFERGAERNRNDCFFDFLLGAKNDFSLTSTVMFTFKLFQEREK